MWADPRMGVAICLPSHKQNLTAFAFEEAKNLIIIKTIIQNWHICRRPVDYLALASLVTQNPAKMWGCVGVYACMFVQRLPTVQRQMVKDCSQMRMYTGFGQSTSLGILLDAHCPACRMDALALVARLALPSPIYSRYSGNAIIIGLPLTTVENAIAIGRAITAAIQRLRVELRRVMSRYPFRESVTYKF
jgi:hypothetical protein